jgi:hypothetical protein
MGTKNVATPSDEVVAMRREWDLIEALLGGTPAMQAAGERLLPKRKLEEPAEYEARLQSATLFPAFAEAIDVMTGRVFAKPLKLGDTVPGWIKDEVLDDVDMSGRNIHVFARQVFTRALSHGLSHVLIDAPSVEVDEKGAPRPLTIAQQKTNGIRPYLITIDPRRILGWQHENGKLTQVRIQFTREEADGEFHSKSVEQVRVYDLIGGAVQVRVFEPNGNGDYVEMLEQRRALDKRIKQIPLLTFYTKRTGFMVAEPPLRELAHLNKKHWIMQSANDTLVEVAQVPILTAIGVDGDTKIVIGAKYAVALPLGADLKFVEHSGAAINSGRAALDNLKDEMRTAGAKLLLQQSGSKTATQASEEASRENSALGSIVEDTQDTLNALLDAIATWRGEASGGDIEVRPNLDADFQPVESMTVLGQMADRGTLSDETLFEEAKRRGFLGDERTWEAEQVRLDEQGKRELANMPPVNSPGAGGLPGDPGGTGEPTGPGGAPQPAQPQPAAA